MNNTQSLKNEIEAMLDTEGMHELFNVIAEVCREKGEWVRSAESVGQPDETLGLMWDKYADRLEGYSTRLCPLP